MLPAYGSWDALRLAAACGVIEDLQSEGIALADATWGEANRLRMNHPFGHILPSFISDWLNMPPTPQSGDSRMPRVARPGHGASLRMVVAPGHEADGIFHLPDGQSGNPRSLYYRAGHEAWVKGTASPFLPGEPEHTLTLIP
ncbi:MAG: penicillin acylase family protein [Candidatus Synoicihabitans palmerolidicus]|nr:penicillin acylase family protein [Candidatus Synoicihabitans palmerolidicus]